MNPQMRKTYERIACLAIALVMLLGMVPVFPASAADIYELTETAFSDGLKSDWLDPTNVWNQNDDGTVTAPAKTNAPYYFNRSNSYNMTNYTFQADVTLPAGFAANTQLGGLCFGVMDGNEAGKVSRYEFTISYVAATDTAEAGWAARVYKRSTTTGDYQYNVNGSNTAVNSKITVSTDRTKETTFTMKVVVDALTMQCYIDDVLVINKTLTQTKDANYTRGAITGGVALYGFGNSTSTFSNVQLMSKNFNLPAGWWQNDGTWTYDMINDTMIAPASNSVQYVNKSSYAQMSGYVFQTDVILPKNANANTQLGGLVFGSQDASGVTSRYEFTVSQTADGWCPRLYKRSTVEGYAGYTCAGSNTTVNSNVKITEGTPFTMRVVLNGLTAACYINDVLVFNFQVTKTSDAALEQGKIMGAVGLLGFRNANAIFSNTKLFKQEYLGYNQNFDELGTDANALLKNEGWMGASGWAGNFVSLPLNVSSITDEGKLLLNATKVVGLRNYQNAYVTNPLTMSNYTFEAEVFVPVVADITDYKLLGLGFGAKEKSSSSYVGYEFSVRPQIDESGNEIWKFRVYDRYNSKTPVSEKTIKNVNLSLGESFTMKVALDGAMAYCYINDTFICSFESTDTIVGFPSLMGPNTGSASVVFDNIKLTPTVEFEPQYLDVRNHDAITLHGVSYDESARVFNRMDLTAAQQIAGNTNFSKTSVYSHARESAGGRIRFNTNSSSVTIKATLDYKDKTYASAMGDGQFGFDIYEDTAEGSIYIGTAVPQSTPSEAGEFSYEATVVLGEGASRDLTIYFPLTIEVKDVKIRVDDNATVAKHSRGYAANEHFVYYGSSITQGGSVTKPGNSYVNIVGREFNVDYTNLGVWGSANGQQAFAEYIAGLDNMTVFVMDYDHNKNSVEDLENTHYSFYETVRAAHPDIPIVMISRPGNGIGLKEGSTVTAYDMKEVIVASYNKAKAAGDENVHFIDGEQFFGYNTQYLPDGTHPNDAGHAAMAEVVSGAMTRILNGEKNVYIGERATVSVESWNVALGDNIGMNFYLNISEEAQDAKIQVTLNDITVNLTVDDLIATDNGYKFSVELAAAQMMDVVCVEIVCGETIIQNEYTIREYADYILDDANGYDDVTKALVKEMLNYGAAAQVYFDYNVDNLADSDIQGTGLVAIPETAEIEKSVSGSVDGVRFYGSTLLFRSKTAVRYYFIGDITNCAFSVDNVPYTPVEKDGMWYVEIADINPQDLNKAITLSVNDTLFITYGPMNYMVRKRDSSNSNLVALLQAMYNYHLAAVTYAEQPEA